MLIDALDIVAFRGERGSYNENIGGVVGAGIVAFRGERGSYNRSRLGA